VASLQSPSASRCCSPSACWVCKLPLSHFGWVSAPRSPSAPAPGSQTMIPGSSSLPAAWPLCLKSISTSRFLVSSGPLYLVHGLTLATVACRLALVCKLPLIPIARLSPPLSGESVPPGCRPPTPGSHIVVRGSSEFSAVFAAFHPVAFNLAVSSAWT
jgi:hypothetical protein